MKASVFEFYAWPISQLQKISCLGQNVSIIAKVRYPNAPTSPPPDEAKLSWLALCN